MLKSDDIQPIKYTAEELTREAEKVRKENDTTWIEFDNLIKVTGEIFYLEINEGLQYLIMKFKGHYSDSIVTINCYWNTELEKFLKLSLKNQVTIISNMYAFKNFPNSDFEETIIINAKIVTN